MVYMTVNITEATCFTFLRVMKATSPVYSYIALVPAEAGSTLCRARKNRIMKDREILLPMEPPAEIEQ
jgi:hypothetical protein